MNVLVILSAAFVAGIGVGLVFPVPMWASAMGLAGGLFLIMSSVTSGRSTALSFVFTFFLVGWIRPLDEPRGAQFEPPQPPCVRLLQGRIVSPATQLGNRSVFTIDLERQSTCLKGPDIRDLEPADGLLYVTVNSDERVLLRCGDRVRLRGDLKTINPSRNLGQPARRFDQKVFTSIVNTREAVVLVESGTYNPGHSFDMMRNDLASFWSKILDPEESNLARALTLGESRVLDFAQRERFRRTGTAHLLSVSGLHLGLAVVFIFWSLRQILLSFPFLIRRMDVGRAAAALAIPVAIAFTLLAGSRTPVVRACVMAVSALVARILGRTSDTAPALAIAGAALLVADPKSLFEPGFQLSFVAVLSFIITLERTTFDRGIGFEETLKKQSFARQLATRMGKLILDLLRSSVAAAAATTPLVLLHFGYISWVTIPVNLIVVPLTGLIILPGLLIVTSLIGWTPQLAELLARPMGFLLSALDRFLEFVSRAPCTIENPRPFVVAAIVTGCAAAILFLVSKRRIGVLLSAVAAILAVISPAIDSARFPPGKLTVDFLDVGQGDCVLITFPNGRHWLVDAGGTRSDRFEVGERIVVPVLRSLGVRQLDTMILTHPDLDHVGGMPAVLGTIDVLELWENGQGEAEGANENYRVLLNTAGRLGIPIRRTPEICGPHNVEDVRVSVIHPCFASKGYDPALSFNNNSIALLIRYGAVTLFLPGDIEHETEQLLLDLSAIGHVDILKLPHHGSRTSSSPALLDTTRPWIGIASAGLFNRHRIPHQEVINRITTRGIGLFRTDLHGAVRVVTDGRRISVEAIHGK
ncbi:MAG: DNA internalization-related competence protein ComEC/Rec2 [Proteobacteria bacterium]|nr:DNA internalization-related competence protein ComEC/Rec2 [Pseudomonadota bacterium]